MIKIGNYPRPLTEFQIKTYNGFLNASSRIKKEFNLTPRIKGGNLIETSKNLEKFHPSSDEIEDFFYGVIKGQIDYTQNSHKVPDQYKEFVEGANKCLRSTIKPFGITIDEMPEVLFINKKDFNKKVYGVALPYINKSLITYDDDDDNFHIIQAILHENLHNISFGLWGPLDEGVTEFLSIINLINFKTINPTIDYQNIKHFLTPRAEYKSELDLVKIFADNNTLTELLTAYFNGDDTSLAEKIGKSSWNNLRELAMKYSLNCWRADNYFLDSTQKIFSKDNPLST